MVEKDDEYELALLLIELDCLKNKNIKINKRIDTIEGELRGRSRLGAIRLSHFEER